MGNCCVPSKEKTPEELVIIEYLPVGDLHDTKAMGYSDEKTHPVFFTEEELKKTKAARRRAMTSRYASEEYNINIMHMTEREIRALCPVADLYYEYTAMCIIPEDGVYDGDTAACILPDPVSGLPSKFQLRFENYDAPEKKCPTKWSAEKRRKAKAKSDAAIAALKDFIRGKILIIRTHGFEKHGRLLGEVYAFDEAIGPDISSLVLDIRRSVSYHMISHGHGYEYHGGTKTSED